MKRTIMLIPVGIDVGLSSVAFGVVRALENHGLKVVFLKPISYDKEVEISTSFDEEKILSSFEKPLTIQFVEYLLSKGDQDKILEYVIGLYETSSMKGEIIICQGLPITQLRPYIFHLNHEIAKALDAEIIFVLSSCNKPPEILCDQIEIEAKSYGGVTSPKVLGCMINKVGAPIDNYGNTRLDLFDLTTDLGKKCIDYSQVFNQRKIKLLGCFPWERSLLAPRVKDIADFLHADIIAKGELEKNRVMHIVLAASTIENMTKAIKPEVMVITPGDRSDIILAICMAVVEGVKISALLLTGGHLPSPTILAFCKQAIDLGLPIIAVQTDSLRTSISLQNINVEIPTQDTKRIEEVKEYIAEHINQQCIKELTSTQIEKCLSPPAFRYQLKESARMGHKRIILPEGYEPRIIKAANICANRQIAICVLLGDPEKVHKIAKDHGISLNKTIQIINPKLIERNYVSPLLEMRKAKGMTQKDAEELIQDPIWLGTVMLALGEVDGLVAGAIHTTAHTIRPALKIIKTKPNIKIVSSIFFMCLPSQVLVYGDCAVNQNPTASQLADIAIQSAESAQKFGIPPRIAMISYSTGTSGSGIDVTKVEEATNLVRKNRPDLIIDGPLQYDAAFSPEVAKTKAPNSPVAGRATVYIFPDLNTANVTYKAVQRSANVLSIGPMLQGLNKPVNDLSMGASIDDIVYTIAITAIQAIS